MLGRVRHQPGLALVGVVVDAGLFAPTRHSRRSSDMGLLPTGLMTLNEQTTTMDPRDSTAVGHENLRVGVGFGQAASHSGFSLVHADTLSTNVLARFN